MRDLKANKNIVSIRDSVSGDVHEFFYRVPNNAEVVSYKASLFLREGSTVKINVHATRLKFGLQIMTGFKKGSFGINGKAFSSDPKDPDYLPEWKETLNEYAPTVIDRFAEHVFEGTSVMDARVEVVGEFEEAVAPLEQSPPSI